MPVAAEGHWDGGGSPGQGAACPAGTSCSRPEEDVTCPVLQEPLAAKGPWPPALFAVGGPGRLGAGVLPLPSPGGLVSSGLWSYCRHLFLSGGHERGRELRYYPFRLTPYLAKVREADGAEGQPCCLLIAERIHSGYEGNGPRLSPQHALVGPSLACTQLDPAALSSPAPRIPPDKRIFTTRHTPSCLFQDVDER